MKFIKSVGIASLFVVLFVNCKDQIEANISESSNGTGTFPLKKEILAANLKTANFNIKGMTCEIGCAKTIQEELNALDGVQQATVDFDKQFASVTFDKAVLDSKKIIKIVEAAADGKTYKVFNFKH